MLHGVIVFVSLIPGQPQPDDFAFTWLVAKTPTLVQKVLHVYFYGVLLLLLVWSLERVESWAYRFVICLIIAVAFGAVLEWARPGCQAGLVRRMT